MSNHWTRPQLLAALNLYFRTPFGLQHSSHPPIVELAGKIGRTPGAVAMKLSNFTSLDPEELARGIKGLSGASNADRAIWSEYYGNFLALADDSEEALDSFNLDIDPITTQEFIDQSELESTTALVKIRRRQRFFRKLVLSSYQSKCAITGLAIPELLIASHIKPWARDAKNRLNPRNGICLSATYDKAFDRGLIGLNESFEFELSTAIQYEKGDNESKWLFERIEGRVINFPEKNLPDSAFVKWHFENIFRG